jgi:hypothetical protein
LCGLDHASAVFDGIQTQFTWVITPPLQEHLRSPQKQRWKAKSGLMAVCSTQFGLCAYKQNPLHRTSLKRAEFGGFVVTLAIYDLISDDFTYKKRRGRESNPRIAVLQTATLPLGYPAICARNERNVGAQCVNAAKRFVPTNVIRDR